MPPPEFTDAHPALYRLREVTVLLPESGAIGPITWEVPRRRRIGVHCASDAQWEALRSLLMGQTRPRGGIMDEAEALTVQSDAHLRAVLDRRATLQDFLDNPETPQFVWLEGRRRSLMVLVDLLGITPAMRRRPLKLCTPDVEDKVWALHFVLSQAGLLVGRDVFRSADPQVREALRRRWDEWPGTLVAGLGPEPLPGSLNGWVQIDAEGHFCAGDGLPPETTDAPGAPTQP